MVHCLTLDRTLDIGEVSTSVVHGHCIDTVKFKTEENETEVVINIKKIFTYVVAETGVS